MTPLKEPGNEKSDLSNSTNQTLGTPKNEKTEGSPKYEDNQNKPFILSGQYVKDPEIK